MKKLLRRFTDVRYRPFLARGFVAWGGGIALYAGWYFLAWNARALATSWSGMAVMGLSAAGAILFILAWAGFWTWDDVYNADDQAAAGGTSALWPRRPEDFDDDRWLARLHKLTHREPDGPP